jgi:hypothetical protein
LLLDPSIALHKFERLVETFHQLRRDFVLLYRSLGISNAFRKPQDEITFPDVLGDFDEVFDVDRISHS